MNEERENEELQRMAPTLFGMPRQDPFVVSDDLFDRFPHEVQAAIVAREKQRGWSGLPVLMRRLAIALPVIAMLAAAWWLFRTPPTQVGNNMAQISTPSIDDLSLFEEHDLLAALSDEELPSLSTVELDLNDQELAAYVEREGIDITEYALEPWNP